MPPSGRAGNAHLEVRKARFRPGNAHHGVHNARFRPGNALCDDFAPPGAPDGHFRPTKEGMVRDLTGLNRGISSGQEAKIRPKHRLGTSRQTTLFPHPHSHRSSVSLSVFVPQRRFASKNASFPSEILQNRSP